MNRVFRVLAVAFVLGAYTTAIAAPSDSHNQLTPVPIKSVQITDGFWSPKRMMWQQVTIPDCFDKFENDRGGALNNFDRVRDGKLDGHAGPPWYDGLIYEMIRGTADFLAAYPDPGLEKWIDGYIARIAAAAAKDPDGYLNTWTQLQHPEQRWGLNGGNDGYQHEMYNVGAMCEAALHYYEATGKSSLLKVAVKLANFTCDQVGPAPKHELVPNHAIAEEALGELYLFFRSHPELKRQMPVAVDENRYLQLAQYWVEARGHPRKDQPSYGAYNQDHKSIFEQNTIEGHAVRAALLCAGIAELAAINGRDDYRSAAEALWRSMIEKKMYITGGIGATSEGEAFGRDYALPNDGYLETCGAVGAAFFARNMNLLTGDARYADVLERELYNGALTGVAAAGNCYTYVNPLSAQNGNARWAWHGCPCCPPMFLKLMGAMPGYIYAQDKSGIYVNLFVGSKAQIQLGGQKVTVTQQADYPWNGVIKMRVDPAKPAEFDVHLRIPGWCFGSSSDDELYRAENSSSESGFNLQVNGELSETPKVVNGYATVHRRWKAGDVVQLTLNMPVQLMKAKPEVEADRGRVALMRGPLVYCFEGNDNGGAVRNLVILETTKFTPAPRLNDSVIVLKGQGRAIFQSPANKMVTEPFEQTAIPYYENANRGTSAMQVWMPETEAGASAHKQE